MPRNTPPSTLPPLGSTFEFMHDWFSRPRLSALALATILAGVAALTALVGEPRGIDGAPRGEVAVAPAPPVRSLGEAAPHSAVLFIGDGMGHAHLRAAETRVDRPPLAARFETRAEVATTNARGGITDSAASGTAMATGQKVHNGVISEARPGNGEPLSSIADAYEAAGKVIGIVTTSELTHATPAAFVSHAGSRYQRRRIAREMLEARPSLMIGGGDPALEPEALREVGYTVFDSLPWGAALPRDELPVAVVLGEGHLPFLIDQPSPRQRPTLAEMTIAALSLLDTHPPGFLLVVEGARIDHASHMNEFDRMVAEAVDFVTAVHAALDWRERGNGTQMLVVATADHETGGLSLSGDADLPTVATWSTEGHTLQPVPLFADGPGADRVTGIIHNTDIFHLLRGE